MGSKKLAVHPLTKAIGEYNDNGMLRIDEIHPLLAGDHPPERLRDAFDDILGSKKLWLQFGMDFQYINDGIDEDGDDREGYAQMFQDLTYRHEGKILAHVSTPVMDGNMFSWGYTTLTWILADDLADLITKGLKWADEMRDEDQKRKMDKENAEAAKRYRARKASKKTSKKKSKKKSK
jgi:hypothetical protein